MDLDNKVYSQYNLCKEMFETVEVIKNFDQGVSEKYLSSVQNRGSLFLSGEGSSRLFPAKHIIYRNAIRSCGLDMHTEGATQALEYDLTDSAVFGVSNSGKTKELVNLLTALKDQGHEAAYSIVANAGTPLEMLADASTLLRCGPEQAVAATKSVVEQALFYHSLYANLLQEKMPDLADLGEKLRKVLETTIDPEIIQKLIKAPVLLFAGRNNGVAEEITLKANEITHKRSAYVEGTYVVHGIEESLDKEDVVVVFNPFESEEEKFKEVLTKGVGVEVIAIASRQTIFPTILIPEAGAYQNYLELAMGWNLLVECGLKMGINLDKPVRARKIGNEVAVGS